jgi:hypothetical protein
LAYAGHARCRLTEVITRLHTRIDVEAIGITMTADHRDRRIATVTALEVDQTSWTTVSA